jgi:hypothetical protein
VFITTAGCVEMLLYCLVSGFAGVFTERLLKAHATDMSFYTQSLLLYAFGVALNAVAFATSENRSLMDGYSPLTSVIIASQVACTYLTCVVPHVHLTPQALNGVLYGVIMRYADNMLRLFIIGGAMLLSTLLSTTVLQLETRPVFWVALLLVGLALSLYYAPAGARAGPTSTSAPRKTTINL